MTVDVFTLVAQIVNFVILLLLLRRFLFRPITRVMREREARIADAHDRAEQARADAEGEAERLRTRREELERLRDHHLSELEAEVREERQALLDAARSEVEGAQARWREALRSERERVLADVRRDIGRLLQRALTRALADLAGLDGAELDARTARAFAARLEALDEAQLRPFRDALAADPRVRIASATPLPQEARAALEEAVRGRLAARASFRYAHDEELLVGVELTVRDHRLGWNLRRYLEELERDFHDALEEDTSEPDAAGGIGAEASASPSP